MKKPMKLLLVTSALFATLLLGNNSYEVKADENLIVESDFDFNVSYTPAEPTGAPASYTLSFPLKEEAYSKYEFPERIGYDWNFGDSEGERNDDGSCTFETNMDENYVYTVYIIVMYNQESQTFIRYLKNGKEVKLAANNSAETSSDATLDNPDDNEGSFITLPYVYLPLIAIVLAVGYFVIFRTNKYVGSLETTEERITKLLKEKEKFTNAIEDEKLNENKKKIRIKKLLFIVRGHLYSIRYIIENMSIENSIDNRELLDECNTVINNINAIDVNKLTVEELPNMVNTVFDGDISRLSILSKRMLITQKKYLEATYGKKK